MAPLRYTPPMAKILLGPTVIGIRGTVAGITFSQNGGGPYARGWHKPPNQKSTGQITARANLTNWAQQWRTLTSTQKASWNTYAALPAQQLTDSLGQPYYASGFNWYITTQINLAKIGGATTTTAPAGARPAIATSPSLEFRTTASGQATRWRLAPASPNLALYHTIYALVVSTTGLDSFPATDFNVFTGIPNANRYLNFTTPLKDKFGDFYVGQKIFTSFAAIGNDGQMAPLYSASLDCS